MVIVICPETPYVASEVGGVHTGVSAGAESAVAAANVTLMAAIVRVLITFSRGGQEVQFVGAATS